MASTLNDLGASLYWRNSYPMKREDFRRKDHFERLFVPSIGKQYVFGNPSDFGQYSQYSRWAELYNVHPGPPYERGGPLLNLSRTFESGPIRQLKILGPGTRYYLGDFRPKYYGVNLGAPSLDNLASSCPVNLDFYGPKGWERYKPNAPQGSVVRSLIEARELPHLFLHSARKYVKKVLSKQSTYRDLSRVGAEEYLNAQFGWKSFFNDIRRNLQVILDHDKILAQLVDESQRLRGIDTTHRHTEGWVFRDRTSSSTSSTLASGLTPTLNSSYYPDLTSGRQTISTSTSIDYWFSAKWRYVIEATLLNQGEAIIIPDDVRYRLERIIHSDRMNPAIFWDVMPWTWLIGWASNVSSNLHNLVDPLLPEQAAEYAFIMGRHEETQIVTGSQTFVFGQAISRSTTRTTTWQMRKTASPFGFGIQFAGLSSSQLAILAALGISRRLPV